jgi:hypothetical protein
LPIQTACFLHRLLLSAKTQISGCDRARSFPSSNKPFVSIRCSTITHVGSQKKNENVLDTEARLDKENLY